MRYLLIREILLFYSFVTSHTKSPNHDAQCVESILLEPQCSRVRCFEQFSIIFRAVDMKHPSIFLACLAIVGSVWGMPQGGGSDPCTPNPCGDNSLCKANGNAGAIACYCQPGEFTKTDYQFQLEDIIAFNRQGVDHVSWPRPSCFYERCT